MQEKDRKAILYIGSWEHDKSGEKLGIRSYQFLDGKFALAGEPVVEDACVGAMYYDAKRKVLYAIDEAESNLPSNAGGGGRVFAFSVDVQTGKLKVISEVPSFGTRTSGVLVDETGKYLLVTNHGGRRFVMRTELGADGRYQICQEYDETNVVLYSLEENGAIGEVIDVVKHSGCGTANPSIQAHPHCVRRSPFGNLYCVCDKGADAIYLYRIDYEKEKLVLCNGVPVYLGAKSAPRYCVFHPTEKLMAVNYEDKNSISVFRYEMDGHLEEVCAISILPDGQEYTFPGGKRGVVSSDLCFHPDGVHLYNITRGVNQIDVFHMDTKSGRLTHEQTVELPMPKGGIDTIRSFVLSPDAKYMLIGAMKEDRVIVLNIEENAQLSYAGEEAELHMYHSASLLFISGGGNKRWKS